MTPKKTMHVIGNPWFARMAKCHVTTLPGAAVAPAKSCRKSTKRVPRYPTGERRGAAGDRTLPRGAGTGNGRAQQRPYGSSSPPENPPPGKAQAGSRRGNGSDPPRSRSCSVLGGQGRAARRATPLFWPAHPFLLLQLRRIKRRPK